jgi:hypothetical protein
MVVNTTRGIYSFYRCPSAADCTQHVSIGAEIAEKVVIDAARKASAGEEGKASTAERVQEADRAVRETRESLDAAIRTLEDFSDEPATRDRLARLRDERDRALDERAGMGNATVAMTVDPSTDWDDLRLEVQRAVVRDKIESARVGPGKGPDRITVKVR